MAEMSIGEALRKYLEQSKLKGKMHALQVEPLWAVVMGKTVAKYTEKIQLVNGTLYISTHVAPLRHELQYQKDIIIARMNEALKENVIKDVVIR